MTQDDSIIDTTRFRKRRKKREKKNRLLSVICTLFVFMLVTGVTMPFILFRGPFTELKNVLIETFSISRGTQFIVNAFFTREQIYEVMSTGLLYNQPTIDEGNEKWTSPDDFVIKNKIEYYTVKDRTFRGHMLLIYNPLSISVAYSPYLGTQGVKTSELAEISNAIAAINGGGYVDYHTLLGNGGLPTGPVISNGAIVYNPYPQKLQQSLIGMTSDGRLICGNMSLNYALNKLGLKEAVSFMPPLVLEGQGVITSGTGGYGFAPRSAIGQRKDGTIILLVLEGRKLTSLGATLLDVQQIMLGNGAYTACALDGGSCSTMVFNGKLVSGTVDFFGERKVPAAFVVPRPMLGLN